MKNYFTFLSLFIFLSCQLKRDNSVQKFHPYSFYVGTYTDKDSQGIYRYLLQKDGVIKKIGLVARIENPTFMTISANKKFLLAVSEIDRENDGGIESFLIDGDSLKFISRSRSGGGHPCFVSVNEAGFIIVANYTGGNVGLLRINSKGELSPLLDVQQHIGLGIHERQQSAHAHSTWFEPLYNKIISIDLGTNELWFSQLDTGQQKIIPSDPQKLIMNPGAGPRHLAFHRNGQWIYVVNELDCTVTQMKKSENGNYEKGESFSTLPVGYIEPNTCADIHASSDGKFVYVSNRGHNSIAIYAVNMTSGLLSLVGHEPTKGDWPRNFSLSPDEEYLLVANQHTNNIISFKRDMNSGLLTFICQIEAPSPVCILF